MDAMAFSIRVRGAKYIWHTNKFLLFWCWFTSVNGRTQMRLSANPIREIQSLKTIEVIKTFRPIPLIFIVTFFVIVGFFNTGATT